MHQSVIYPRFIPSECSDAEIKMRSYFEKSEGLTIVHQLNWQMIRGGKQSDGEADFIVFYPGLGILVLEVKGGGIEVDQGVWFSRDRYQERHKIKNPTEQARDSKYALINFIKKNCPLLSTVQVIHAVAFPDITVSSDLGMDCPKKIILDRAQLQDIGRSISNIFAHWGVKSKLSSSDINTLINKILPTKTIYRSLQDEISDGNKSIIELTKQQVKVLAGLNRNSRSVVIGGAGTGKTMLAVEKASQLAQANFKVILLCYNKLLKSFLKETITHTNIRVETYHSLVESEANKANITLPATRDEEWFEHNAPSILVDAFLKNQLTINSLIIDEGQDFSQEWLDSLEMLLQSDCTPFYIFMDPHQDLYKRGAKIPINFPCYELTKNCRNTSAIHYKVSNIYSDSDEPSGIIGPDPVFSELSKKANFLSIIETVIDSLLNKGVLPSQIVVLTNDRNYLKQLLELIIDDVLITNYGKKGIHAETINKFKGLERDFILLALSDKTSPEYYKASCYVGFSRAKMGLYVIAPKRFLGVTNWNKLSPN